MHACAGLKAAHVYSSPVTHNTLDRKPSHMCGKCAMVNFELTGQNITKQNVGIIFYLGNNEILFFSETQGYTRNSNGDNGYNIT